MVMLNIVELAKEVHANAIAHGWWESERKVEETMALIHSEWSEALEEYRASRPMIWYACTESEYCKHICNPADETECLMYGKEAECKYRDKKPEGIAVELIDGVIRILDYLGKNGVSNSDYPTLDSLVSDVPRSYIDMPVPVLVTGLHLYTSLSYFSLTEDKNGEHKQNLQAHFSNLYQAIGVVCAWLAERGINYYDVLIEKHEYNKTRSYKHGNKVC